MGAMWFVAVIAVVLGIGLEYITTLDHTLDGSGRDRRGRGGA
jgi:hypothetical protein